MAGWSYRAIFFSGAIDHFATTHFLNSSALISTFSRDPSFFRSPFEKISRNSQVYLRYGLLGLFQLPQAVYLQL